MCARVGLLQTLDCHVRINLRRRKARVSEQGLNAAKIRAIIEQMGSETMPKFMRTERNRNRSVAKISLQDQPNRTRRNPAARLVDKEWP